MNFFEHQENARLQSRRLLLYFLLSILSIIAAVDISVFVVYCWIKDYPLSNFFDWLRQPWWIFISLFTLLLILLGNIRRTRQLKGGGKAIAEWVGATRLDPRSKSSGERRFVNVVEEMSIASGVPVPDLWVMEKEQAINAFVAGRRPAEAVLVVTRGSLDNLARDELQAVVAHEFSHIHHGDMFLNLRLLAWLAGITVIGQLGGVLMRSTSVRAGHRSISYAPAATVLGALLAVIGWVGVYAGRRIKASISRQREFLADASSVRYTRDTRGITSALVKIMAYPQRSLLKCARAEEISHMCFGESLRSSATHPPLQERIRRIAPDLNLKKAYRAERKQQSKLKRKRDLETADARKLEALSEFAAATQDAISVDAGQVIESIGNPSPRHVEYAIALHDAIPQGISLALLSAADARLAVMALLLGDKPEQRTKATELIAENENAETASRVLELHRQARPQWKRIRLAIVDLAIPQLRKLPPAQRQGFIRLVQKMIAADGRMSLFEYTLQAILSRDLAAPSKQRQHPRLNSFRQVEAEIAVVLSLMIGAGENVDAADGRYARLLATFTPTAIARDTLPDLSVKTLNDTLHRLNCLVPLLKETLVRALIECVLQDGHVTLNEAELLRAVADTLDCPIPPLIQVDAS